MSLCYAFQPGVIDFPARCKKSSGHTGAHQSATGLGADYITWEDDEHDS